MPTRSFALVSILALTGCGNIASRPADAVATVNGQPIRASEFQSAFRSMDSNSARAVLAAYGPFGFLAPLIEQEILRQAAEAEHIVVSETEIAAHKPKPVPPTVEADVPGPDGRIVLLKVDPVEPGWDGLSDAQIRTRLAAQKLLEKKVDPTVQLSPADVEAYYRTHPSQFAVPAGYKARYLCGRTRADGAAIQATWRGAASFAAARESLEKRLVESNDGQEWLELGKRTVEADAVKLRPGKRSGVLAIASDLHCVIELMERRPAGTASLAEVRPNVEERARAERLSDAYQGYLASLKAKAQIWMAPPDVLERVLASGAPDAER